MGNYTNTSGSSKPANTAGQIIDIVFDPVDTTDSDTSCATPLTSGGSGNCAVNKYMTHPAFITMDVNGLWVGKFAAGGTTSDVEIKPNIAYLTDVTASTMFNTAYNYNRDLDSHMMKNTEWGAVAYLSHSNYGVHDEIRINNTSTHITGCAANSTTSNGSSSSTCQNQYNTPIGYLASATGNITGVYDMTVSEYTTGYVSGKKADSGFSAEPITLFDQKYFDVYSSSANSYTSFNYRILGDGIGEMAKAYSYNDGGAARWHSNWHEDYMYFLTNTESWNVRGGGFDVGTPLAGSFASNPRTGKAIPYITYRIVLAPKQAVEEPTNDAPVNTCEYAVNDDWTFDYTGDIQNFTVPCTGTYKLEVWGAGPGGKGGYSHGNVSLSGDDIIYVVVGGTPYNGGGGGGNGSGGGATHIGKTENLLKNTAQADVYLVAGGGGSNGGASGGYGGGTNGSAGGSDCNSGGGGYGASQTGGGGGRTAQVDSDWNRVGSSSGSYGQGGGGCGSAYQQGGGGGGGGWYGGGGGCGQGGWGRAGGGGGSGYIGGVTDGETIAGNQSIPTHDGTSTMTGNSGNGYAKITLISY
jgi:hypothetical protein